MKIRITHTILISFNVKHFISKTSASSRFNLLIALASLLLGINAQAQYSHTISANTWSSYGSQTLSGVSWTAAATGGAFWAYDATKGQQFGSAASPATSLTLSTTGISGTITSVKVTTSGAASVVGTVAVSVGGTAFSPSTNALTATSTQYTFTGTGSGQIIITWSQSSAKALYLKALDITYSTIVNPTVTTTAVSSINTTTAASGGNVTSDGGATVSARGVVWNTSAAPTVALSTKTTDGTGTGTFTSSIASLTANTKYFYRAYATNSAGTGYGSESNFTTLHNAPVIGWGSNATAVSIDANWTAPATAGGEAFTYEVEIANNTGFTGSTVASGIASGTLTKNFTGLTSNTPYYFRVRAVNAGGNSAWSSTSTAYATLPAPKVTAQDWSWTTGSTWVGGFAPADGDDVTILHNVTAGAVTRNFGTITTISSTGKLTVSGTFANGGTTTVNGTFQLDSGGYASGNNFVYGSTGSLNFNANYGVDNSHSYWPTSNGPFNVNVLSGILTLNTGTNRIVNGTFQTAGGVAFSGTLTLNGTAKINSGGYFSNSPTYGSASTLVYNLGYNFFRGNEWNSASGAGYPNNVQLSNPGSTTTVTMGSTAAQCAGNLTIDPSTVLSTPPATLTIIGNVTINGTINFAGDVKTNGNWIVGASGNQLNNNKAVFFTGTTTQTVIKTGGGVVGFDYLIIDKTGTLAFDVSPNATDVTVNSGSGGTLQLLNGTLNLNGRELKMQNGSGNILVKDGRTITSSVANGKLTFLTGKNIVSNSSSAADTLLIDANVNVFVGSSVNFGHNGTNTMTTINGLLQIDSGGSVVFNSPVYGPASTLRFATGGTYGNSKEWTADAAVVSFPSSGYPNNVEITNSTTLDLGANSNSATAKATNGYLTIADGSKLDMAGSSAMTKSLTVKGDFTLGSAGTATVALSTNANTDLYLGGDLYFNGTYQFYPNNKAVFFTKNGTQKITASSTPTIPYIVFQPMSGTTTLQLSGTDLIVSAPNGGNAISFSGSAGDVFDLNGRTLTIGTASVGNTVTGSTGSFKGSASSNMTLLGSGSIGTINFTSGADNLGTLTLNRQPGSNALTLGTNLTINTSLVLTNGLLSLGTSVLTIAGSATTSGASFNSYVIADLSGTSGTIRKSITGTGSFTFPIGDKVTSFDGSQYSPATVNFTSGTFSSAYITVGVNDIKHPNNDATIDFLTRYWSVTSSGTFTSPVYSFTGTYLNGITDRISGSAAYPGRWDGTTWSDVDYTPISGSSFTLSGLTTTSGTNEFSAGNPLLNTEIDVRGNATSIVSGSSTPATADHTDFGSVAFGGTVTRTFTIYNLGGAPLNLASNPSSQVTLSGSSAFAVTAQPSSDVIIHGGSLTFQITYTASAFTAQNAIVSIVNNDANENPYTFAITGVALASAASDIIANAAYVYNSNFPYATYQSATITNTGSSTNGSLDLFKFDIRDGGGHVRCRYTSDNPEQHYL
ncbi:beta strand repeat-containing protein [Flavobacterium sp. 3HN19-14]|uniref:beta strand repeat-containing protein n=1 Tax=Flavobacterium sp. 3HN19-14 TaxID=3448133 RepID=UPI003EE2631C